MKKHNLVYLAAVSYAVITGLSFLFAKTALKVSSPLDLLAHRFTASFIVVLIMLVFKLVKVDYCILCISNLWS